MDWQQLQSLYNQKESVKNTGTLAPEIITPAGKHPLRKKKTWLMVLVLVLMIGIVVGLVYILQKPTKPPVVQQDIATMTPEQVQQIMIDEVITESKNNPTSPQELHDILSGKK